MPKTKKTKKEGGKAKPTKKVAKKTTKKSTKKARPKAKKKVVKAVAPVEKKELAPEEEAALARKPEFDIEAQKEVSGREELDRLIETESLSDRRIFSRPAEEAEEPEPAEEEAPSIAAPATGDVYMTNGEQVSIYRKILLWASVGLCAVVIIFGWVLTIGGSLGLKKVDAQYDQPSRIDELTEDIKNELEDIRDDLKEQNEQKTQIEDDTLENLVEEIKNSTTTDEAVGEEGRDIFSPPTTTDEIIE